MPNSATPPPGAGVDARGVPVTDPTKNVLELVAAAIQRQDDLRTQESVHIREIIDIRAQYDQKLREAETARIDAIRTVDVGNVTRAAEVAAAQAATLASQLETTRIATATSLGAALEPIQKDIAELRKSQYELAGAKVQNTESRGFSQWAVGAAFTAVVAIVALIGFLAAHFH